MRTDVIPAFSVAGQGIHLRTLIVVRSLKMGGMERVAADLADAFAEAGHESHIMVYRKRSQGISPAHPGVKLHVFPLRWAQRMTGIGWIIELLSRMVLNVLIRRSHSIWTGWLGGYLLRCWQWWFERRYGRLDRIIFRGMGTFEVVWSYRDERACFVQENTLASTKCTWIRRMFAKCLFSGKHLVAVSQGVADTLIDGQQKLGFEPASLSVIVNPCPVAKIRRLMREAEPDIPDEPYIVNVARLVPQKDQALLLRAYSRANPREKLVIVGAGPLSQTLQRQATHLGIADKVMFCGQRDNPYPWMRHARLFVLSSKFEGMGIVLTEALACGTPVISVNCPGGIREVLKGPLANAIAPRTETGLASHIQQALTGPKPTVDESWVPDFLPQRIVDCFLCGEQDS